MRSQSWPRSQSLPPLALRSASTHRTTRITRRCSSSSLTPTAATTSGPYARTRSMSVVLLSFYRMAFRSTFGIKDKIGGGAGTKIWRGRDKCKALFDIPSTTRIFNEPRYKKYLRRAAIHTAKPQPTPSADSAQDKK